jgi:hypothetical protein
MAEKFEDQYLDVLQNIEFALVSVYREHPKMTDWAAHYAVDTLIRTYSAEAQGRALPAIDFQPLEQEAYDRVKEMCDWRLGRKEFTGKTGKVVGAGMEPKSLEEIIACLKRIRTSIERWQKKMGRRGYFEFVNQFIK